ncbi:uncharacterized protein LOC109837945 [Asparagus officinalis]|nr:uncharacterized protein LOC109837945 [Asparagus officinalis]
MGTSCDGKFLFSKHASLSATLITCVIHMVIFFTYGTCQLLCFFWQGILKSSSNCPRYKPKVEMSSALAVEEECYVQLLNTEDRLEGLAAFAEKRKPRYAGKKGLRSIAIYLILTEDEYGIHSAGQYLELADYVVINHISVFLLENYCVH